MLVAGGNRGPWRIPLVQKRSSMRADSPTIVLAYGVFPARSEREENVVGMAFCLGCFSSCLNIHRCLRQIGSCSNELIPASPRIKE